VEVAKTNFCEEDEKGTRTLSEITVVIPTSPIPVHPSTEVIERAIDSILVHLPYARILILVDGVRPEMQHRKDQYEEYVRRVYVLAQEYTSVDIIKFEEHRQQAGMLKVAIDCIRTPLLMFFEHDATLDDKAIDWEMIKGLLLTGLANTVRFYWHKEIHPEHTHLMGERFAGDFIKTNQWSSWPHISRTDFYRKILDQHFAVDDKKMTETVLYSPVLESPWEDYKTVIYAPEPDAIRFHHWDARRDPVTGEKDPGDW
jgi:hypothetical protein